MHSFVWFPVCENLAWGLPLYYKPRETRGWVSFSSSLQARRIWYLLKIEKSIFLPVATYSTEADHTQSPDLKILLCCCLCDRLFEFEGSHNRGLSAPKDVQVRTSLDLTVSMLAVTWTALAIVWYMWTRFLVTTISCLFFCIHCNCMSCKFIM